MIIVIFRARLREGVKDEYVKVANRMMELVSTIEGFESYKEFVAEDGEHVSIMEFATEEAVAAWRANSEHLTARNQGKESFFADFRVQVCAPVRDYSFKHDQKH